MKKLVFVIPSLGPGGAERSVVNMANYYADSYHVTIVGLYKEENILYKIDSRVSVCYFSDKYTPSANIFSAIISNLKQIYFLYKICLRVKANSIISFTTSANIISIITAKILRIKVLITERANPNVYVPNLFWRVLRKSIYKLATNLIVQTAYSKDYFSSLINTNKIVVIPNLINPNFSDKRETYQNRDKIILTVGRLDDNKSQDLILKAFAKCNLQGWKLQIVGSGVNLFKYKLLSEELSISDCVEFIGNVQDVEKYYNQSSIFVFASKSEGYPNALLEALYFGLPSIATNCNSGPCDLIENDGNGFLTDVGNVDQIVEKLNDLAYNEELRFKFSRNALISTKRNEGIAIMNIWDNIIN